MSRRAAVDLLAHLPDEDVDGAVAVRLAPAPHPLEQNRVVSRDELLQKVWGRRLTHRDRTVDVFVRRLRDKIEAAEPRRTFIQTRYGVGYKLEADPKSRP